MKIYVRDVSVWLAWRNVASERKYRGYVLMFRERISTFEYIFSSTGRLKVTSMWLNKKLQLTARLRIKWKLKTKDGVFVENSKDRKNI